MGLHTLRETMFWACERLSTHSSYSRCWHTLNQAALRSKTHARLQRTQVESKFESADVLIHLQVHYQPHNFPTPSRCTRTNPHMPPPTTVPSPRMRCKHPNLLRHAYRHTAQPSPTLKTALSMGRVLLSSPGSPGSARATYPTALSLDARTGGTPKP